MTEAARTTRKPSQIARLELAGRAGATAAEGVKVVVDMSEMVPRITVTFGPQ
jgi:hypothetical protein